MRKVQSVQTRGMEYPNFSTVVFITSEGMGPFTTVTHKRLAFLLSVK